MTTEHQGPNYKALVTDALLQLELMQQKLDTQQRAAHEPIAIVGMGCRYPGGINSPEDFWQLLQEQRDGIGDAGERWNLNRVYDPDPMVPGKMYSRHIGMMDRIAEFDAEFFGIAPREAESMDPQQRILLEVSWHALEQAGYSMSQLKGSKSGVYIGIGMQDYSALRGLGGIVENLSPYDGTGNALSVAAGRIAYVYGLRGPAMAIETACSSSLVAMHLAIQSLRSGETDMALAGGVNLVMNPATSIVFSKAMLLSPDGRCRTFDKAANGYVRSDGCGLVVLKRLGDAVAAGDKILALVRGSAVNQDGRSQGITAPNERAQEDVIRAALKNARVAAADIDYIEAHGTGTALGDPIEVNALGAVFSASHDPQHPLLLGSVKSSIGHAETAAGIAGVIKTVLAMQHKTLPAQLHFDTPNPYIPWHELPFSVVNTAREWSQEKRFAGVSSFGFSGTNAHVVLQAVPAAASGDEGDENNASCLPLTLSARDPQALQQLAGHYANALRAGASRTALCYDSNRNRGQLSHKLTLLASDSASLTAALDAAANNRAHALVQQAITSERSPKIAFVFAGQGPQFVGMGQQLYAAFPVFRAVIDRCEKSLRAYWDVSLQDVLWGSASDRLGQTRYTQAALFAVQYACAELWRSFGVRPSRLLGHSFGEYAAACLAGVFSVEDALMLLVARGGLPQEKSAPGLMLSILADRASMEPLLAPYRHLVSFAAINGPHSLVISGALDAVVAIEEDAHTRGFKTRRLDVSHAFHSPMMDSLIADFRAVAARVTYHKAKIPLISCLTARLAGDDIACAEYWVTHLRNTVEFADGVAALAKGAPDILLEMGPGSVILGMTRALLDPAPLTYLPTFREAASERNDLLQGLLQLHHAGTGIQWQALYDKPVLSALTPPRYPFQRRFYWFAIAPEKLAEFTYSAGKYAVNSKQQNEAEAQGPATQPAHQASHFGVGTGFSQQSHPLFNNIVKHALLQEKIYEVQLDPVSLPWLKQHKVYDEIIVAGGFFVSAIFAALKDFSDPLQQELRDIRFLQPLRIGASEAPLLSLVFRPDDNGFSVELLTRPGDPAEPARLHARADIRPGTASAQSFPVEDWQAECANASRSFERDEFYTSLKESTRLFHGADFQWNDKLWCVGDSVVSRMKAPPGIVHQQRIPLHAGLVDSCFQAIAALALGNNADNATAVPRSIDRMQLLQVVEAPRFWCRSQISNLDATSAAIRIQLTDESAAPILEIDGFRVQKIDAQLFRQLLSNVPVTDCWELDWQPLPAATPVTPDGTALGNLLLIMSADAATSGLKQQLQPHARSLVMVQHQSATVHSDGPHIFDLTDPQRLAELIARLDHSDWQPDTVVHAIGMGNATGPANADATADVLLQQQQYCGTLLTLMQALPQWKNCRPRLVVVTAGAQSQGQPHAQLHAQPHAQSHTLEPHQICPTAATLWGMMRSARLEYSDWQSRLIDTDASVEITALVEEILQRSSENEILLRGQQRLAPRIQPVEIDTGLAAPQFDATGMFLISGGFGELGQQTAQWLVDQGVRQLALCGRSAPGPEQLARIEQWQQLGVVTHIAETDVADPDQVQELIARLQQTAPLRGLFHCAGQLRDKLLANLQWQDFIAVMAPKLAGAWNLHCATRDIPLDHFVCYSSVASFLGNAGQSNYSAANAFVDELMRVRRAAGLPGQSINWGPWAEVGMASQLNGSVKSQFDLMGISALETRHGLQRLGIILQQNPVQRAVLPVDWPRFLEQWPLSSAHGFLADIARLYADASDHGHLNRVLIGQIRTLTPAQRQDTALRYIETEICRVLNKPQVDLDQSVLGMGIDSLMAMEFRARLKRELALEIPVPRLLEGPSIRTLALYVADQFNDAYFQRIDSRANAEPENDIEEIATAHLLDANANPLQENPAVESNASSNTNADANRTADKPPAAEMELEF